MIRNISPELASDEAFLSMSMPAKAALPLLWCHCDDQGVFEWKPQLLRARIFPGENLDFAEILEELVNLDSVRRIEIDSKSYGLVRNFCVAQPSAKGAHRFVLQEADRAFVGAAAARTTPAAAGAPPAPIAARDMVGDFLKAAVVAARGDRIHASALYRAFASWCDSNDQTAVSNPVFGVTMARLGYSRIKSSSYFWLDIELISSSQPTRCVPGVRPSAAGRRRGGR